MGCKDDGRDVANEPNYLKTLNFLGYYSRRVSSMMNQNEKTTGLSRHSFSITSAFDVEAQATGRVHCNLAARCPISTVN